MHHKKVKKSWKITKILNRSVGASKLRGSIIERYIVYSRKAFIN